MNKRNKGLSWEKKILGISVDQVAPAYWGDLYAGSNSMCMLKNRL